MVVTTGCAVQTTALVRGRPSDVEGGALSVEGVVSKLRLGIEQGYERVARDGGRHGVLGLDLVARVGIIAALVESRCAAVSTLGEPSTCIADPWWFEVGPAVGVGLATPTANLALLGHAWIGAWADLRLWSASSYPVVRIEVQSDLYSGEARGAPQLTIGLGFVTDADVRW